MHLAKEVVCQAAIVVQPRQVCTTYVADLQLLMSTGTRGITKTLELPLALILLYLVELQIMKLLHGHVDGALLAQNLDFHETRLDGLGQVADAFQKRVGLANFIGRLFQASLGSVDSAIAVTHVSANVGLVVEFEAPVLLLRVAGILVLFAEVGQVGFGAGA